MRTAFALDKRASLLQAVDTPAIETAIAGAAEWSVVAPSAPADSTRPTACFSRGFTSGGDSDAAMNHESTGTLRTNADTRTGTPGQDARDGHATGGTPLVRIGFSTTRRRVGRPGTSAATGTVVR